MAKLVFFQNGAVINQHNVRDAEAYIVGNGKAPETVDFIIDSPHISKIHARIETKDGKLFITDLKSTNGTYLNGIDKKLTPEKQYELSVGDAVYFAKDITIKLAIEKADDSEIQPSKTIISSGTEKFITLLEKKGSVSIGRDESNDIHIPETYISR
ncbi:MAG: FHA domain-containing protein, partial [Bacteroidales bacterium]|nr:FHA domain-containing protein [Bacteroidales bacterium]